jgi:creatinine amidohydrolase
MEVNMSSSTFYTHLRPQQFRDRLAACPVGYIPLGTLEWHGEHGALGTDAMIPTGIFARVAQQYGGIVFPPVYMGPDRIRLEADGSSLQGMEYADSTTPPHQLAGGCYWLPEGLFQLVLENLIQQAKRAGFTTLVADGHGPSRILWNRMAPFWEAQYGIRLIGVTRDIGPAWCSQIDHAAINETSLMLALHPELIDLSVLPTDRAIYPQGVGGPDPRDATAAHGEALIATCVQLLIAVLTKTQEHPAP